MTCGIYKLEFVGGAFYIGKSENIEERFKKHLSLLKSGNSNYKLNKAFKDYGLPTLHILEECNVANLNMLEMKYIQESNACKIGLNILDGGDNFGSGEANPNSKISNARIEEVFKYVYRNLNMPIKQVATDFDIAYQTLHDMVSGRYHLWLKEIYPEEYLIVTTYKRTQHNGRNVKNASERGITYNKIKSPDGFIYNVQSVRAFAKEHSLGYSSLHKLLTGKVNSYKGWTLLKENIA